MSGYTLGILDNALGRNVAVRLSQQAPVCLGASTDRLIQLTTNVVQQIPEYPLLRTVTAADSLNLLDINLGGRLWIGDADNIVANIYFTSNTGSADITPIVVENQASKHRAVARFETKTAAVGSAIFYTKLAGGNIRYLANQLIWDTQGAQIIIFHVTAFTGGGTLYLYGGCLDTGSSIDGAYCTCTTAP